MDFDFLADIYDLDLPQGIWCLSCGSVYTGYSYETHSMLCRECHCVFSKKDIEEAIDRDMEAMYED